MGSFSNGAVKTPLVVAFVCFGTIGGAQSASEVTPDSFVPPLRSLAGTLVFNGEPGTQAPPGAEQIGITLGGVRIDNALPQLEPANTRFRTRLTRSRIPVSELFEATADLEADYAAAGLVLTRVVLPQQNLRDGGTLRVEVVNGFIEEVDLSSVPASVRDRMSQVTAPVVDRAGITLRELERQILLAGDMSGVALNTALASGLRPGGAVLALDAGYRRITGFVGFDNFSDDDFGTPTLNFGLELNSALGQGETLYTRGSTNPDDVFSKEAAYRVGAVGVLVPVGDSGLTLNVEATASDTRSDDELAPTTSEFRRQSVRLSYPYRRSRQITVSTTLSLDLQSDEQELLAGGGVQIHRDELTVLRAGTNGSYLTEGGALIEGGAVLSQGLDLFGARSREDAQGTAVPLSRQEADAVFSKLTGFARVQRDLTKRLGATLSGRFQTSFGDPLLTSEQFGIVGANELSTFDLGEIRGDAGWVLRSELSMPFQADISQRTTHFTPYVFLGYGGVRLHEPTAVEHGYSEAHAFGIGLDLLAEGASPFRADSLRIEVGKGERTDGKGNSTQLRVSGNIRF